jgi:3-methylfumaryl-CoA hydratase
MQWCAGGTGRVRRIMGRAGAGGYSKFWKAGLGDDEGGLRTTASAHRKAAFPKSEWTSAWPALKLGALLQRAGPCMDYLRDWMGRVETRSDDVTAAPLAGLNALLDGDSAPPLPGSDLPALAHWLYFVPLVPQRRVGADGLAPPGDFLPPVPLPRRLWAGARLQFMHPLRIGDEMQRTACITDVRARQGRTGALVFVSVRHEIRSALGLALTDTHDLVYRDAPLAAVPRAAPVQAPTGEAFSRRVMPDPVLLFRYAALTGDSHRIHYDRAYATQVEGYPGLVVQGPLVAMLLLQMLYSRQPGAHLTRFEVRARVPLFDLHAFTLCGRTEAGPGRGDGRARLWVRDHAGRLAMEASAAFS